LVRLGGCLRWFRLHMKVHFYRDRVIHSHEGYILRHPEVTPIEFEVREDLPATSAIAIQGYLKHDRFGDAEQRQISLQLQFVGIARGSHAGGSERDRRIVVHRKEPWSLDHLVLDTAASGHAARRDLKVQSRGLGHSWSGDVQPAFPGSKDAIHISR